jgi:aspartyl aminopeptidase
MIIGSLLKRVKVISLFSNYSSILKTRLIHNMASSLSRSAADDLVSFINASPSPFHAVDEAARRLTAAGFTRLDERDLKWNCTPGGKYFVSRNQSALVSFVVGGKFDGSSGGFTIAAGHSDSPCLRVKPISTLSKAGYLSVGVETYGGGIWHTWFDRDLGVAGRAIVDTPGSLGSSSNGYTSRLVRIDKPILKIPSLAIHLDRTQNDNFKVNAETSLPAVLATSARNQLNSTSKSSGVAASPSGTGGATTRHHMALVEELGKSLGVPPEAVRDFELCLFDTQPAQIGGVHEEFIFSPRLDNLCMTHSVISGLIASSNDEVSIKNDSNVRIAACFDHEEVGSNSIAGAGSTMLEEVMHRLVPDASSFPSMVRKSFLVSADMAHAVHPNHAGVHEENHRPAMHAGIVIKQNTNQRYATNAATALTFREIAKKADVPLQDFCVRQDAGCGSTIGPIVATRIGVRTVDIGVPQLSMHSIREMCGTGDVSHSLSFFESYFKLFPSVDSTIRGTE